LVPTKTAGTSSENKKNPLHKVYLMTRGNYICNICKTQIYLIKNALLFFAVLLVRRHLGRINGKEYEKTSLRPSRLCGEKYQMTGFMPICAE
jgi:hypothetical protein